MFDRFVKGEGAVVVVLKPADRAVADNDHIYSVASPFLYPTLELRVFIISQILASSINSNGNLSNLHAPSWSAQKECVIEAFAKAGRSPSEVDFVELHATGCTPHSLIELSTEARTQALRSGTRSKPTWQGRLSHEASGYSSGVLRETSGKR